MADELEMARLKKRVDELEADLSDAFALISRLADGATRLTKATMDLAEECKREFARHL